MKKTRSPNRRRGVTRAKEIVSGPERSSQNFMNRNRGTICLLGAAASGWQIYRIATATEGPSQTLALMQYTLLAIMVIATLVTGAQWLTMK
jgi:hypothetical protein